jgi:hypothetical protein
MKTDLNYLALEEYRGGLRDKNNEQSLKLGISGISHIINPNVTNT